MTISCLSATMPIWKLKDKPVPHFIQVIELKSDYNQYILYIHELTYSDVGQYTCYGSDPDDDEYIFFESTTWIYGIVYISIHINIVWLRVCLWRMCIDKYQF